MDLIYNEYTDFVSDIKMVVPNLRGSLSDCEATTDELMEIENWAAIFSDHSALVKTVTKNLLLHNKHVIADLSAITNDW